MAFRFKGGIHPAYNKERTMASPIEKIPGSPEIIIPLSQHIGAPCDPLVKVGDSVKLGQKIGDSTAPLSAPVHASVSGTVKAIEPRWHPSGIRMPAIVIENDGLDTPSDDIRPYEGDPMALSPEEIIEYARNAGIVGMGGASFPLHVKIKSAIERKVETLIINGCECEPYITCDHRGMLEYPHIIVKGIKLLMRALNLKEAFVAIEDNKKDAIATMQNTAENTGITVLEMKTKYPQGGEKQLIKAITDRELPPGKLPMDIGCAVFNIDTCASLWRAIHKGLPLHKRVVTVSGSAVETPKNLLARIGTPYSFLFERCGGFIENPYKIIAGGPMMGTAQHSLETPVVKNSSALLAFAGNEEDFQDDPTCIHCGRCIKACPMFLMPNLLYQNTLHDNWDECRKLNVMDCIECGCCSYVCPGKLYLVQAMRKAKGALNRKRG